MSQRRNAPGLIYLLHFERRLHHAGHYLGFVESDLERRLEEHRTGRGSRLMAAIVAAGIGFVLVRTWEGDRHLERKLKKCHHVPNRLCPVCMGKSTC